MSSKSTRVTNVQVPGADPASAGEPTGGQTDATQGTANTVASEKAAAKLTRPSRAQYADMRADEVDASKLTASVLTKDGWVCPPAMPSGK